jgi:hypothetical protein
MKLALEFDILPLQGGKDSLGKDQVSQKESFF